MTLTVNLHPETERGLIAQAMAKGISPASFVEEIVAREVMAGDSSGGAEAKNLVDLFENSPFKGLSMTIERDQDYGRDIIL